MSTIRLVDASNNMKHYSALDMLEDALEQVRANPEAFKNAYLLMRENAGEAYDHHHVRAGFRDDEESLAYLAIGYDMRVSAIRRDAFNVDTDPDDAG